MKKLIASIAALSAVVLAVLAADPRGRVDTRLMAGQRNYSQDEFDRNTKPFVITPGVLYFNVTNQAHGIICGRSNATVAVHIVLPNPTNNVGRKFVLIPLGACTITASNAVVGTIRDAATDALATTFSVASNRVGVVYSTGTNYIGVLQ